jgi:hypothetical protein
MRSMVKKIFLIFLLIICLWPQNTLAASGMPNSSNFGYGVRVNLHRFDSHNAIQEAGKFNVDWIAMDLNWQNLQPKAETPPSWYELDAAMTLALENQLSVMISITQAPRWAMVENGPSPRKTSQLIIELVRRYPDNLLAIEIFPLANSVEGWGSAPDPGAYTQVLKTAYQAIKKISSEVLIVGAGLSPVQSPIEGMDDLSYLRQIYAEGISEFMPIVGLRLPPSSGDPLSRGYHTKNIPIRRYENIRSIMSENGHKHGLIWITGFSWNVDTIVNPNDQADWMKQAYLLFRSQLYIGAAFFDGLNPTHTESSELLLSGGTYHPGFEELIKIIAQDNNMQTILISSNRNNKRITGKIYPKAHLS